jgi:uncharacterized iron-regulated membrane protein
VLVTPIKNPKTKATTNVINVFIFVASTINISMFSFKQYLNQIEEQVASTPNTGVTPTASTMPATTTQAKPQQPSADKTQQVPATTRAKLDAAAQKNAAAMRLYSTGKTKEAVDTLRKDPNFQLAMQDLTKTMSPANASQLVNAALGGNA